MKIIPITFLALSSLLLCGKKAYADSFISPDKRFTVLIADSDDGARYAIKDHQTVREDDSIEVATRFLWLKWADDSRTFVTIEHLAGGTYARVMHFKGNKWICYDIQAPVKGEAYFSVVKEVIKPKMIQMTFKIDYIEANGKPKGFGLCTFDVDVETGDISNIKNRSIDYDKYVAFKELGAE